MTIYEVAIREIHRLTSENKTHVKQIEKLEATNKTLVELADLRDQLLICYRVGKQPTEKLLNRLQELRPKGKQ